MCHIAFFKKMGKGCWIYVVDSAIIAQSHSLWLDWRTDDHPTYRFFSGRSGIKNHAWRSWPFCGTMGRE